MKRSLKLNGIDGKSYDLESLKTQGTRTSSKEELIIEIWYWNPNATGDHKNPNPPSPEIGRIWLSKRIDNLDELNKLLNEQK